ncbi:MAG: hypothetical protein OXC09_12610 [Truepera sp.]|nr:hypothetical protein [Truepera sp.]
MSRKLSRSKRLTEGLELRRLGETDESQLAGVLVGGSLRTLEEVPNRAVALSGHLLG